MGSTETRHPIIVDTDALIAVANTDLWPKLVETITLTTTNVCLLELEHHVRTKSRHAPAGSREQWVYEGSNTALEPFEDDCFDAFSVVTCVPRPHGEDAGEESIRREIAQHPEQYTYAILMDADGRRSISRTLDEQGGDGVAVAPTFLLYLLYSRDVCTKSEFCAASGDLLKGEGWTGYKAVQAAWDAIPVDCSDELPDNLVPE